MELAVSDKSKEWTVDDYLGLGEESCYQLINGELITSPSPSIRHQLVLKQISHILDDYSKRVDAFTLFAPIDIYFDDKNVFQPDAFMVSSERKSIISDRGLEGAPDLEVEVLSASNSQYDRYEKREKYHEFGVLEYWLVDPSNSSVEVFDLQNDPNKPAIYQIDKGRFKSLVFSDLNVDLKRIFDTEI